VYQNSGGQGGEEGAAGDDEEFEEDL